MVAELSRRKLLRRTLLAGALVAAAHQLGVLRSARRWLDRSTSLVGVVRCDSYAEPALGGAVARVLEAAGLPPVAGKRVVLKPNFVDHFEGRPVETDARLLMATVLHLRRLGAREVTVAEGAGNRNDLAPVLETSGLSASLARERVRFVDLNYDDLDILPGATLSEVEGESLLGRLALPRTLTRADLVISMPKLKTHHHVGVTLSLKNLFGCVPGVKYGWPKNVLHWNGIDRSILEIYGTLRARVPMFALLDGIVGMEGDGPLHGTARQRGLLVAGADLASVDAVGARSMGLAPGLVAHLGASQLLELGRVDAGRIRIAGELPGSSSPFAVPPKFRHLVAAG
ncbi:MAG: DUF362 domain-containing protein [Candidatus Wallbacteria bacterium]|nr:DUF362 domain-containing protein [Candidatus Wallbacteria bacterium]